MANHIIDDIGFRSVESIELCGVNYLGEKQSVIFEFPAGAYLYTNMTWSGDGVCGEYQHQFVVNHYGMRVELSRQHQKEIEQSDMTEINLYDTKERA